MRQILIYICTNKFERGPMQLGKQMIWDQSIDKQYNDYIRHYQESFQIGEYSALHLLELNLDPANGITEVLRNEYSENPLKTRIVINPAAAKTPKKSLKVTIDDGLDLFTGMPEEAQ